MKKPDQRIDDAPAILARSDASRRKFLAGLAALPLAGWAAEANAQVKRNFNLGRSANPPARKSAGQRAGSVGQTRLSSARPPAIYDAIEGERFSIPAVGRGVVPKKFWRAIVDDPTGETPGTIVVDTPGRYLYHVLPGGKARRYGVGVGRAGFSWQGKASIAWKRKWPTWTPPASMIEREPQLEKYRKGMKPGLKNPLGARALYIHEDGVDTLYRIHGTNEPDSIGKSVSSGCIRMLNQDVIHLYDQVRTPAVIVVLQGDTPLERLVS